MAEANERNSGLKTVPKNIWLDLTSDEWTEVDAMAVKYAKGQRKRLIENLLRDSLKSEKGVI